MSLMRTLTKFANPPLPFPPRNSPKTCDNEQGFRRKGLKALFPNTIISSPILLLQNFSNPDV